MDYNSTILIADDHQSGREILKGLLHGRGYRLIFASNGVEALKQASTYMPDLILLDVMMPGMDGFEVCQHLRADPLLAEVPVIMVTALDDHESRLQGIEAGADDFISKPFDHAELQSRVQTITRLNRYRRLLSERAKFEWVVEQANEGYVIVNRNDEVLYANSQARLFLGLGTNREEPIVEPFLTLAKKLYRLEPQETWGAWPIASPSESVPRYLVRPATTTANVLWLQIELIEMGFGAEERFLIRLKDVTATVLEQRSMWTFHGQVSHKLRSPLNHVLTAFELVQLKDLECLQPDIKMFLEIAFNGAAQLKDEVQDIFDYLDASNIGFNTTLDRCNLTEIMLIADEVNAYLKLKSIKTRFQDIPNPDATNITLSRRAVEVILWELLGNAKKFHPQQLPSLEIDISLEGDSAALKISDDGLIMAPEQLIKIWAPYYQAEKYFTGQVKGTGIGLAMVASLIWSVGGSCRALNRVPGPGLVIDLTIPLQK